MAAINVELFWTKSLGSDSTNHIPYYLDDIEKLITGYLINF